MATPENPVAYRKLTGWKRGLGTLTQLWVGPDHLLHIHSTGYTESYRRFYFRDIQSMLIVHTNRRLIINCVLGFILALVLLIVNADGFSPLGFTLAAVPFTALFLWNNLLGAGCRVVMISAVQQENIPSLCRVPKTRRILNQLVQMIRAAQADLVEPPPAPAEAPAPVAAPPGDEPPPLPPPALP